MLHDLLLWWWWLLVVPVHRLTAHQRAATLLLLRWGLAVPLRLEHLLLRWRSTVHRLLLRLLDRRGVLGLLLLWGSVVYRSLRGSAIGMTLRRWDVGGTVRSSVVTWSPLNGWLLWRRLLGRWAAILRARLLLWGRLGVHHRHLVRRDATVGI